MNSLHTIMMSMAIALVLSFIYLCLVQCCPKFMNKAAIYCGAVIMLGLTVCLFIYPSSHSSKFPIAIILLFLLILVLCSVFRHRREIEVHGIFLEASTNMLKE